jgi:biopolymer transport protein ExbB/TolQ
MHHLLMLAAEGGSEGGMFEAFKTNPWFLALNMVVSAVVITIIVERAAFQLGRYRVNSKEFFAQIKKLVAAGNIDRAIKLCDASDYPILQLVKAGLTHANKGADEIDAALSEKLSELKPAVEKRVGTLWSLANIAQADKQRMLSNGIAEAMYNTAFGLSIAVVCMVAHVFLHTRSKNIQHDLDSTTERVFNLLTVSGKSGY